MPVIPLFQHFYRPQRSCEDYVFTPVCHSVHRGGSASVHAGIPPPPRAGTPRRTRHSPPPTRHPPRAGTPRSRRLQLRTVRILLECILVNQALPQLHRLLLRITHYTSNNKEAIFGFMQSCSCLSCRILCSTTPGVTCTSSACRLHAHVICMLSACHPDTSSAHTHIIHTSSAALLMVSMDLNYLSTLTGSGY